ncbi:hypothetical protein HMPREF9447_01299 [Bacteroides oleiciplenus YIT 12058]|uniref:FHA domain-containing protein n=2 Tax=Bacteroides oleiciplenus TaxID=626931 RepID=K9EQX6_9BACE|nr:hypothetical protein HMPREF9447_01299 [Bacteroides oleiciplenus YIT 12058]
MNMKTFYLLTLLLCVSLANAQNMRKRILLNSDWRFAKGHAANPEKDFNYGRALSFSKINFLQEATLLQADQKSRFTIPHTEIYDDSQWERVSLPHDWGMTLSFAPDQLKVKGYRRLGGLSPENSVGWYRKNLKQTFVKGCRYHLEFEGIFRDAQVWMNGIYLGKNESGYVPLLFDVTECLNYEPEKENVITVRVNATQSELWSYEGAGIYRNVWLTQTSSVHIPQWGTFVTSDVDLTQRQAVIEALIEVANESDKAVDVVLKNSITDIEGKQIAYTEKHLSIHSLDKNEIKTHMQVNNAHLWSPETPYLYTLRTEIEMNNTVIDSYVTRFGIRTITFSSEQGFLLNGKRVQLQGVCCHQDHAGVGVAVPDRLNAWRIQKLKEFGTNAYRASHNPPTVSLLDACDSLGIMVIDEMRMMSSSDEGLQQMKTIIRRDRNHPSIILWSLGNEEPTIQKTEKGRMIAERMKRIQHKLDPTRMCTAAMNGGWGSGFSLAVDVQGSNYFRIGNLDNVHEELPLLPCILTEEASTLTTRGIYSTIKEKDHHQSYDHDRPSWGSTAQEWMRYVDTRPYIGGAFVWTGFDYGGEALMYYWPGVVSNFGILDYCSYPKDAYWYYKAWWTNEPVLHILPHWNGIGIDSVDVQLYTNMDEAELFLNNKSLGKKTIGKFDIPTWRVKYTPGKLTAKGKNGNKKYIATVETTGKPASLQLTSETGGSIKGDGNDIAIITVKIIDSKKRIVPTANNRICFKVENGVVLGVGNGNPSCHEPDVFPQGVPAERSAFSGYAQLIVASDRSGKSINIVATSEELRESQIQINIQ